MKFLNIITVTLSLIGFLSCKDSGNDTLNSMSNKVEQTIEKSDVLENREYPKLFCDMLSQQVIKEAFSDARDLQYTDTSPTLPMCKMTFLTGEKGAGVMLSGQHPSATANPRKSLERKLEKYDNWKKLDDLGDEAYFFPRSNMSRVIVMKDGLRYELDYTSQNTTVHEDGVKLMRVLISNL